MVKASFTSKANKRLKVRVDDFGFLKETRTFLCVEDEIRRVVQMSLYSQHFVVYIIDLSGWSSLYRTDET